MNNNKIVEFKIGKKKDSAAKNIPILIFQDGNYNLKKLPGDFDEQMGYHSLLSNLGFDMTNPSYLFGSVHSDCFVTLHSYRGAQNQNETGCSFVVIERIGEIFAAIFIRDFGSLNLFLASVTPIFQCALNSAKETMEYTIKGLTNELIELEKEINKLQLLQQQMGERHTN